MLKLVIILILLFNFLLFGCVENETETTLERINVDGVERTYNIFVPKGSGPFPLVFVLHGGGGNALNAERMSQMTPLAKEKNFIVVYPNGSGKLTNSLLTWNGGNCCDYAIDNNINDVKFFQELINEIKSKYNVNEKMIYFAGFSNGAFMSHKIACELSNEVAAIASVAGSIGVENCNASEEVSVIIFHGTADEHVPYYGGVGKKAVGGYRIDNSVEFTFNLWKEKNICEEEVIKNEFGSIVHEKYSNCANNSSVELYTIINQGHAWPGGINGIRYGNVDPPTKEISATDLMVDFFFAHPKP